MSFAKRIIHNNIHNILPTNCFSISPENSVFSYIHKCTKNTKSSVAIHIYLYEKTDNVSFYINIHAKRIVTVQQFNVLESR